VRCNSNNYGKNRIEELIAKYNEGLADPSEIKLLEKLIEEGALVSPGFMSSINWMSKLSGWRNLLRR